MQEESAVSSRFAIEVDHPQHGWTRLQGRYANRKHARGWLPFVRKAWAGLPARVVEIVVEEWRTAWVTVEVET